MAGTPTPPTSRGRPDPDAARALYQRHADSYDVQTDWADPDRAKAVSLLELRPGHTVVDVGCGTGLCFATIVERIGPEGRLVGIEPSVEMLGRAADRVARAGWGNVDLRLGLAEPVTETNLTDPSLTDTGLAPVAAANGNGR
jgi:ubiquinone/menaquinone biosynthesis C-methylase UbiE